MSFATLKGIYSPINPDKYIGNVENIVFRSSWERKLMVKLDINPNVLKWSSEELVIPYYDSIQRKQRRYFVDFTILYRNPSTGEEVKYAIEVKPFSQTVPPTKPKNNNAKRARRYLNESLTYRNNLDKWKQAQEWCKKNNFRFVVLHEKNSGRIFK